MNDHICRICGTQIEYHMEGVCWACYIHYYNQPVEVTYVFYDPEKVTEHEPSRR